MKNLQIISVQQETSKKFRNIFLRNTLFTSIVSDLVTFKTDIDSHESWKLKRGHLFLQGNLYLTFVFQA